MLDREEVAAAFAQWRYVSPDAAVTRGDGWTLVRNPDHFASRLEAISLSPSAPPAAVVSEVLAAARRTGLPEVQVWLSGDSSEAYAALLAAHGGTVSETLALLARDLTGESPSPRSGVSIDWVRDLDGLRDEQEVEVTVFGGERQPDAELAADVDETVRELESGEGGRLVARLDGRPVGTAALSMAAGPPHVGRLWGGAVLEPFRRRGVYSDLLAFRLGEAATRGAGLALVKGRVDTSAPILARAGFETCGMERAVRVPLGM